MYRWKLARAALLGVALCTTGAAAQATPLFDFTSNTASFKFTSDTLGYAFTVSSNITVDGIGMLDFGNDGLGSNHEFALWDNSDPGTKLRWKQMPPSTTTSSDPSISGLGSYVYVDIAPLILSPGITYVLGASFLPANASKDDVAYEVAGITSHSGIATFVEGRLGRATGINAVFPGQVRGNMDRYFGPNLRIATAIPEPLTLALLVVGLAGIGLARRNGAPRMQPQSCRRVDALPT